MMKKAINVQQKMVLNGALASLNVRPFAKMVAQRWKLTLSGLKQNYFQTYTTRCSQRTAQCHIRNQQIQFSDLANRGPISMNKLVFSNQYLVQKQVLVSKCIPIFSMVKSSIPRLKTNLDKTSIISKLLKHIYHLFNQ